jgi:GH43 family beta-xylosidase
MTKGNGNYGPGHATFFFSPDGSELWISHHCLHDHNPSVTGMVRHCHCQRVYFDETGFPHIGMPVAKDVYYPLPAGDVGVK